MEEVTWAEYDLDAVDLDYAHDNAPPACPAGMCA
jgi:hypothetical protein